MTKCKPISIHKVYYTLPYENLWEFIQFGGIYDDHEMRWYIIHDVNLHLPKCYEKFIDKEQ